MRRERALKIVLVLVGLLFCAAVYPLMLMAKQDPALAMMMSLYAALGVFLLLASRNPSAHSQPDRLHRVVELCTRDCHGGSGIPKFHRSPRTARSGYLHCDRRSTDRSNSGKTFETANREGTQILVSSSGVRARQSPSMRKRRSAWNPPLIPECCNFLSAFR